MSKFKVGIARTVCCCHEFEVEADTEGAAIELVMQQAYDTVWDGGNVDYELDYIEET